MLITNYGQIFIPFHVSFIESISAIDITNNKKFFLIAPIGTEKKKLIVEISEVRTMRV